VVRYATAVRAIRQPPKSVDGLTGA
jgi:hypothetical protein